MSRSVGERPGLHAAPGRGFLRLEPADQTLRLEPLIGLYVSSCCLSFTPRAAGLPGSSGKPPLDDALSRIPFQVQQTVARRHLFESEVPGRTSGLS